MKIAILGGGGFRVPLVFGGLLDRSDRLGVDEVVLHDVDPLRQRRIAAVLEGLGDERGVRLPFRSTESLEDAVDGADFLLCAIRVGGLEGRVIDEAVPLAERVVGQETTGPGGIAFALRTVPVMIELADTVAGRAPGAWFLNFTNPAGLVTEALRDVLGERVIGICDTPASLCRRVAAALGRGESQLRFDYAGLNHFGWLMAVHDGPVDLLPALLADDRRLETLLEGRLFGRDRLRRLGMIPNEYLAFYEFAAQTVAGLRNGTEPRGAFLRRQQAAFYGAGAGSPADALGAWRRALHDRDRTYLAEALAATGATAAATPEDAGGYERVALDVMEAIALDRPAVLILDTGNGAALPFLDERAVVEVPCRVDASGVTPLAPGPLPADAQRMLGTLKQVERLTIRAALERSRTLALEALALHPLVPSGDVAGRILDAYAGRNAALAWAGGAA